VLIPEKLEGEFRRHAVAFLIPVPPVTGSELVQILSGFQMVVPESRHQFQKRHPMLSGELFQDSVRLLIIQLDLVLVLQLAAYLRMYLLGIGEPQQEKPASMFLNRPFEIQDDLLCNLNCFLPWRGKITPIDVQVREQVKAFPLVVSGSLLIAMCLCYPGFQELTPEKVDSL